MKNFGIKDKLHTNWKELTFIAIFTILNIFFANYAASMYEVSHTSKRFILLIIMSVILEFAAAFVIFKAKQRSWSLEKIFLCLFIPVGLIYLLAIPIGRVPDEPAHLTRAYGISVGHFITSPNENGDFGEYLPYDLAALSKANSTYDNSVDILIDTENDDDYVFVRDSGAALYNFINFIPQSIGFFIGRIIHLPAIFSAYLARLLNFSCFVALFYFALKKAPFGKNFLFFVAFLPIVLQEVISLSADCLAIGMCAALISFVMYLAYDKSATLTRKNYIFLLIAILFVSLCKIVYLPLCFLILIIPHQKFKSKKDKYLRTIIPLITVIALNFIWLAIASQYLIENNPGVNSSEQIKHILTDPLAFARAIFSTCLSSMYQFAYGMLGGWLEWLDVEIGHIYLVLSIIISTILVYKTSESKVKIPNLSRALIIAITIAIVGLIFTSLYVQWNPVGSGFVGGLQGRYFIPVFLLAPSIACGLRTTRATRTPAKAPDDHRLLYLFSVFQSFAAVLIIICSHLG